MRLCQCAFARLPARIANLASNPRVIGSILPRSLQRGRSSLLQTGDTALLRAQVAGHLCFICFQLFFPFFSSEIKQCCECRLQDSTALFLSSYFSVLSLLLMNGLYCTSILALTFQRQGWTHCSTVEKINHNKESFNLQLCQHLKRSFAGGSTF